MAYHDLPRLYCFSLGDFHNFEKCYFDFLIKHHLQKRYELEEGNDNQAIGNLLDLVMKIIHRTGAYHQNLDYILTFIFKAAEGEMRDKVARTGPKSFYGATIPFLTEENINIAKEVFKKYYQERKGKFNEALLKEKFWECLLDSSTSSGQKVLKVWGGPDALELGEDGTPEVVDYKFFEDAQKGKNNLDMNLMPKLYTLLCAQELLKLGHQQARFRIRSWTNPGDESLYEEFELGNVILLKDFFRHKIEKILAMTEISFCDKPYCKACNSEQRQMWIRELKAQFNLS